MRDSIRADLETALKSQAAQDAGLIYTGPQDTRLGTTRVVNGVKEDVFPVYIVWGGRTRAGNSGFHRGVFQVVLVLGPMQTKDPWARADEAVDAALEIIYTVPSAFPELLPTIPLELSPSGTAYKGETGGKMYACAVIQVVGP